ncbi:LOW QUALITY PROTEIN: uncharacterized protein [Drosophila tropicalis]|uniref:LOW QUALITY PROTEIN: uncharacterized protein n=1 Tax=Drosophila tropicalis TaxID=46794 RepID=UPI0035AB73AD
MTLVTMHLMVIAVLLATATSSSVARANGGGRGAIRAATSITDSSSISSSISSSTQQVPTIRAPRQRSPFTTQPIDIDVSVTPYRNRGSRQQQQKQTQTQTTPLPSLASSTATSRQQRRRFSTTTTTSTSTTAVPPPSSRRERGNIRAARQPRNTPTLKDPNDDGKMEVTNALPFQSTTPTTPTTTTASSRALHSGALKTPRMIQRLVAGHIHNAQGHSTYEVSAVSANSSSSASSSTSLSTATPSSITTKQPHARRKTSSSFRLGRPTTSTTTRSSSLASHDYDDDEALLSEPDDFDNWDNGILRLSAGSGKETADSVPKKQQGKEDSKKTLADQVRDGKYGLIEKELFRRIPKRPGVLSYARNSEVPADNERNFGGLNEQDIWLAEDHLLVIKGGSLNEESNDEEWPAIDDYDAPTRQIKLPDNPVKPPPFPVQLEPHGPLQLIPNNQLEIHHTSLGNGTISAKKEGKHSAASGGAHATHSATRSGAATTSKGVGGGGTPTYIYPSPYAPWLLYPNETLAGGGKDERQRQETPAVLRPTTPLLGNWLLNGLNGNDTSLPAVNVSDFDEDDPSLYYPPAYSFVYKSNYSNPVPPGPLVPGIVLPPPPDHFSRLDASTTSTSTTTTSTSTSTTTTTTTTTMRPKITTQQSPASVVRTSYKPKYNAISYLPPKSSTSPPRRILPKYVERVPVPVAVPIPIYPINYTPHPPTEAPIVFVPSSTTVQPPLSKSNPIYYEYFEAKRQPASIRSNVIDDFLATKPPKRHHFKSPPSAVNDVALDVVDVVKITPKPRTAQIQALHAEYNAALGQLLRSNLIAPPSNPGRFKPPDFDRQPFLPMVNYSVDEQDQNAFKAIVFQPTSQRQLRVSKHQQLQLDAGGSQGDTELANSYLPERQLRMGKQQQLAYEPSPPTPHYLDVVDKQNGQRQAAVRLRPPAQPIQFWQQRPPPPPPPPQPQFKRIRQGNVRNPSPIRRTLYPVSRSIAFCLWLMPSISIAGVPKHHHSPFKCNLNPIRNPIIRIGMMMSTILGSALTLATVWLVIFWSTIIRIINSILKLSWCHMPN